MTAEQINHRFPLEIKLRDLLQDDTLDGAEVVAGDEQLDQAIARVTVGTAPAVPDGRPIVFTDEGHDLDALLADLAAHHGGGGIVTTRRHAATLAAAGLRRAPVPVIVVDDAQDTAELAERLVARRLELQAFRLARSEQLQHELLELVLGQGGLEDLVACLADAVGTPILLIASNGRISHSAGTDELELGEIDRVDQLDERRLRIGDRLLEHVSVPIASGQRLHGSIVAVPMHGDRRDVDVLLLRNTATVAALVIAKDLEVRAVEDKYRSDLMHDLLTQVDDPSDALRRARSFGWDIERRLIVLVVRFDDPPEVVVPDEVTRRPALANALRQAILARDPSAAVVEFSREVVILTRAFDGPSGRLEAGVFARSLVEQVSRTLSATVSAGQSRPVQRLDDIRMGYLQATAALQVGREIYGRGTVQHFLDLGVYRLLSQVDDPTELETFAREVLNELHDEPQEPGSLLETLRVLLEENCNFAAASRRLHFHYNTLRHRASRLEQIVGPFLRDHRVRLNVEIALLIKGMEGLHLNDES